MEIIVRYNFNMVLRLLCLYFVFVVVRSVASNEEIKEGAKNITNVENKRNSRGIIYSNEDTFFSDGIVPFYKPITKISNNQMHSENDPSAYQIYQLQGLKPLPYMLPLPEMLSPVDPMYENKLNTFNQPESSTLQQIASLCQGKRAQIPSARSCSTFVNCWDGVAVEQECLKGLLFSERGYCDYPHRVNCGNRPITSRRVSCEQDFSTSRDPDNCGQFHVCVHGEPALFTCPAGLHYSEKYGVCDYPYMVQCDNPVVTQSDQTSTAAPDKLSDAAADEGTSAQDAGDAAPQAPPLTSSTLQDAVRFLEVYRRHDTGLGNNFASPGNIFGGQLPRNRN